MLKLALLLSDVDVLVEGFHPSVYRKWPTPCGQGKAAVIDIGTHVGDQIDYWARNFGKAKGCSNTHIFLFEPNPATHAELLVNLKKTKTGDNFLPQRMAVSNRSGVASFYYNRGMVSSAYRVPFPHLLQSMF